MNFFLGFILGFFGASAIWALRYNQIKATVQTDADIVVNKIKSIRKKV